jgi:hypothetical protein
MRSVQIPCRFSVQAIDSSWLCILCIDHYRKLCVLFLVIYDMVVILSKGRSPRRTTGVEGSAVVFLLRASRAARPRTTSPEYRCHPEQRSVAPANDRSRRTCGCFSASRKPCCPLDRTTSPEYRCHPEQRSVAPANDRSRRTCGCPKCCIASGHEFTNRLRLKPGQNSLANRNLPATPTRSGI